MLDNNRHTYHTHRHRHTSIIKEHDLIKERHTSTQEHDQTCLLEKKSEEINIENI